jgi:hypothetical protein
MKTFLLLRLSLLPLLAVSCMQLPREHSTSSARPAVKQELKVIDPRAPWNDTEITLHQGQRYRFTAEATKDADGLSYSDRGIRATPDGVVGLKGRIFDFFARDARCPLDPAHWRGPGKIKRLRVLRDRTGTRASFLTVIGCVGKDDAKENVFVIGKSREITCWKTDRLFVFSNDWPGGKGLIGDERFRDSASYSNNTGAIKLVVETLAD